MKIESVNNAVEGLLCSISLCELNPRRTNSESQVCLICKSSVSSDLWMSPKKNNNSRRGVTANRLLEALIAEA